MRDDRTPAQKKADALRVSMMSADRPLDALVPELTRQALNLPKEALHPRVLELGPSEGDAWVLAMWGDPGSLERTHEQVRKLLEATLLASITRAADTGEALDRVPNTVQLLVFCPTPPYLARALKAFGFRLDQGAPFAGEKLEALRQEGIQTGWDVPARPSSVWLATISQPATNGDNELVAIHKRLRELINDDCWGNTPGAFSRCAANLLRIEHDIEIEPTLQGLDTLEDLLAQRKVIGSIRWIPAALFQALADFIGVIVQNVFDHKVEWALCEPEEDGYGPPPLFRITTPEKNETHLAIGLHLLRWSVMPILPGEDLPRLSAWLESEFGNTTRH